MTAVETTQELSVRVLRAYREELPDEVSDALSSAYVRLRRLDSDLKLIAGEYTQTLEFAKRIAGEVP